MQSVRGRIRRMSFYLVEYEFVPDIINKRLPFREEHLAYAKNHNVILGGALDPPKRGILVVNASTPEAVEVLAQNDPYVLNDLVLRYSIHPWNVAINNTKS